MEFFLRPSYSTICADSLKEYSGLVGEKIAKYQISVPESTVLSIAYFWGINWNFQVSLPKEFNFFML